MTDEDVKLFMEKRKILPYPKAWAPEMEARAAEKAAAEAKIQKEKEDAAALEA